jgi:putative heme-binding domain-containing protein
LDVVQIAVPKSQGELLKLLNNRRLDVRRAAAKAAIAGDHWDWCRTIASGEIDAQRSDGRVLSELMNYDPDGFDPGGKEAGSSWASLSADQRWCRVSTLFGSRSEDPYLQTRANWCLGRGEVSEAWILKRLVNPIVTCDEFNSTGPISLDWASRTLLFAARSRIPRSTAVVHRLLDNTSPVIRRLVLQWVAEEGLTEFRPQVEAILNDPGITSDLFLATLAALEMLDGVPPQEFDKTPARKYVVPLLRDANRPAAVRSQALRLVAANDPALDARLLGELMASSHPDLRRETVRTLQFKSPAPDNSVEQASRLLLSVLHSTTDPVSLKADALVSLSAHARGPKPNADSLAALRSAALSLNATLRREGLRGLRGLGADDDETRKTLASLANTLALIKQPQSSHRELAEQLALTLGDGAASLPKEVLALRPKRPTSVEEWKATLSTADNSSPRPTEGEGPGVRGPGDAGRETQGKSSQQSHRRDAGATDQGKPAATPTPHPNPLPQGQRRHAHGESEPVAAGRRTFFHPNSAGCFKCHTVNGRGGNVGPDLSTIARSMSRDKLIESILEPSREVAPQFTTWTMETADGQVHSGMIVHENEGKTVLGDAEAKLTELKTIDIVARTPQRQSVMPDKLADRLTVREFRDLLAFLESLK